MSDRNDPVEVEVEEITAEADLALCCLIDGVETWLPKSQIDGWQDYIVGDANVVLAIPRWLAAEKGLAD
jgi:hypothetical protein